MNNGKFVLTVILTFGIVVIWAESAFGVAPYLINYQGRLSHSDGMPFEGTHSITFSIYNDEDATAPIWTETHDEVSFRNGTFSVMLGSVEAFPDGMFAASAELWIELTIDATISFPRKMMVSVPFALDAAYAEISETAKNLECSGCISEEMLDGTLQQSIADASSLEDRVSNLENDVSNLSAQVSANRTDIDSIQSDLASISSQIENNSNSIQSIQDNISTMQEQIFDNSTDIQQNSINISNTYSQTTQNTNDIQTLYSYLDQVSRIYYYRNSSFENGLQPWHLEHSCTVIKRTDSEANTGSYSITVTNDPTNTCIRYMEYQDYIYPSPGEELTITFFMKGESSTHGGETAHISVIEYRNWAGESSEIADIPIPPTGNASQWQEFTFSRTIPSDGSVSNVSYRIQFPADTNRTYTVYIDDFEVYSTTGKNYAAYSYAGADYPGGPATDLACSGCVANSELEGNIAPEKIQDTAAVLNSNQEQNFNNDTLIIGNSYISVNGSQEGNNTATIRGDTYIDGALNVSQDIHTDGNIDAHTAYLENATITDRLTLQHRRTYTLTNRSTSTKTYALGSLAGTACFVSGIYVTSGITVNCKVIRDNTDNWLVTVGPYNTCHIACF